MTMWNVWYDDWQMECCGTPFSVGDEVAWPLRPQNGEDPGEFRVETHGDDWPVTRGRVRFVHIVSRVYRQTAPGSRTYEAVPGTLRKRPVDSCPKWFTGTDPTLRDDGVLVGLEVPDAGPAGQRGE
ncbi:DUF6578 domain-containing protein [Streptomyces sp. NPDC006422]|uniref:DUF6578 domain-containing protein n=1 Tax=unclassified Streptomyces TaxID=2593676 RepID=UPI0033A787D3